MRPLLLLAVIVPLAGCGGDEREPRAASPAGPGVTVSEALAYDADDPVLVRGALHAHGGQIRLCEMLAESYPPQCGGASLLVEGLALADIEDLESARGVSWTETEVKLLGSVENGTTLVVSDTAR